MYFYVTRSILLLLSRYRLALAQQIFSASTIINITRIFHIVIGNVGFRRSRWYCLTKLRLLHFLSVKVYDSLDFCLRSFIRCAQLYYLCSSKWSAILELIVTLYVMQSRYLCLIERLLSLSHRYFKMNGRKESKSMWKFSVIKIFMLNKEGKLTVHEQAKVETLLAKTDAYKLFN